MNISEVQAKVKKAEKVGSIPIDARIELLERIEGLEDEISEVREQLGNIPDQEAAEPEEGQRETRESYLRRVFGA